MRSKDLKKLHNIEGPKLVMTHGKTHIHIVTGECVQREGEWIESKRASGFTLVENVG